MNYDGDIMENYIDNLSTYVDSVVELNKNVKRDIQFNDVLYFRGQSNKDYELMPSLGRKNVPGDIVRFERNVIEMAKLKLPSLFNTNDTPINLLALLQHYGIPTRLLDVTTNPLVALFFACDDYKYDGEIIVLKNNEYDLVTYPIMNAIADTYRFAITTWTELSRFYSNAIMQSYFLDQKLTLSEYTPESGGRWIATCCDNLLFVRAKELSARQKIQQGSFILFPNNIYRDKDNKLYFEQFISPIRKDSKFIEKRFIIKKESKKELLKQLAQFGITKSMLFPDNLDYICKEIAESQLR